jgi:hypothetical protein
MALFCGLRWGALGSAKNSKFEYRRNAGEGAAGFQIRNKLEASSAKALAAAGLTNLEEIIET